MDLELALKIIARQSELLGRAENMLNPGREHRMDMDKNCKICRWLGQVGDLTLEPPILTDSADAGK
jgi:hypothetical protein